MCFSERSLIDFADPAMWGADAHDLRYIYLPKNGMLTGLTVFGGDGFGQTPLIFNSFPLLTDPHSQLFIKGNLGIPGTSFGNCGQDILRRVAVTSPKNDLIYDHMTTQYNKVRVSAGMCSTLWFQLVGYDGLEMDLVGGEWSFVAVIFGTDD